MSYFPHPSNVLTALVIFASNLLVGLQSFEAVADSSGISERHIELKAPDASLVYEEMTVADLPDHLNSLVFLPDITAGHLIDTRVLVVDGKEMTYLATIPTGMVGLFSLSSVRSELYVATTYLSRGTRGTRTDVVEIYDAKTLQLKSEIEIPSKRAQAVAYSPYMQTSKDGKFLYIQNLTPASSITVIDLKSRQVASDIETSGCVGIYPSPVSSSMPARFSTICGDGSVVTVTLSENGQELSRARSKKIFNPASDPLFISHASTDVGVIFISFLGMVHELDLRGSVAVQSQPWSVLRGLSSSSQWRPGGYHMIAYHRENNELFVAMHSNGEEGSHKNVADEIWRINIENKKVIERIAGQHAVAIGITQEVSPSLFVLNGENGALMKFKVGNTIDKVEILGPPLVEGPASIVMP